MDPASTRPSVTLQLASAVTTTVHPSPRVLQVAAMFGLGVDEERLEQVVPPVQLTLRPGQVVFVHGPSGSGKSTLLRLIRAAAARESHLHVIDEHETEAPATPLLEQVGATLEDATKLLALAGLGDAFVMLRSPAELSDGQRYRWRLARALEAARRIDAGVLPVVLADEFAATLDRETAATIAGNVRRFATRARVCFIAATTHDDLLEALAPDVLVYKPLGAAIEVLERP
jgi:hypothetical protein